MTRQAWDVLDWRVNATFGSSVPPCRGPEYPRWAVKDCYFHVLACLCLTAVAFYSKTEAP